MRSHVTLASAALSLLLCAACSEGPGDLPPDSGPDGPGPDTVRTDPPIADAGPDTRADSPGPDTVAPDGPAQDLPTVPVAAEIEPGVYRELIEVPAPAAPPNPDVSGAAGSTPAEQNRVGVLRYRAPGDPAAPAQAIVVAIPGFLGGANDFDEIGRRLVKATSGAVELWAIDRRENFLEDLTGMQAAEAAGDPQVARDYYFNRAELGGRRFGAFLDQDQAAHMSEWGLATFIADLRAVMELVPEASRQANVILLGHSLGATLAQAYAGWDFEGSGGASQLAGLVLLEGGGTDATVLAETDYRNGFGSGFFATPGLDAVRSEGPRYVALPGLGAAALATLEITGLAANLAPEEINEDPQLRQALGLLQGGNSLPTLTNASALGMAIDDHYSPITFAQVRAGVAIGGDFETYTSILGPELLRPSDSDATYTWVNHDASDPVEVTSMATVSRMLYNGPTNFQEWYFPTRLQLDAAAIGDLADIAEGDWRLSFGLQVRHTSTMDAPVLCIGGGQGLTPRTSVWDGYRDLIAAQVGEGRPSAGADRQNVAGFRALIRPGLTHIDVLSAVPGAGGDGDDIPKLLQDFALLHTTGTVSVP